MIHFLPLDSVGSNLTTSNLMAIFWPLVDVMTRRREGLDDKNFIWMGTVAFPVPNLKASSKSCCIQFWLLQRVSLTQLTASSVLPWCDPIRGSPRPGHGMSSTLPPSPAGISGSLLLRHFSGLVCQWESHGVQLTLVSCNVAIETIESQTGI